MLAHIKKRLRNGLALIIVSLLLGSCSEQALTIGFIGGLTGGNADLGEEGRNAVLIGLDDFNESEKGKTLSVNLLFRDDGNNADMARQAARDLIDAGVDIIIGPFNSAMTEAVKSVTEEAQIPVFTPTAAGQQFIGRDDQLFRMNRSAQYTAGENAVYARDIKQFERVNMFIDQSNPSYTESWAGIFSKIFIQSGGKIPVEVRCDSSEPFSYADAAKQLLTEDPDAVYLITKTIDAARLSQQIRRRDQQIQLMAAEWAGSQQLIELGGEDVQGLEVFQPFDKEGQQKAYLNFTEEYTKRYGRQPSFTGFVTYETVNVILQATLQRGSKQSLKESILSNSPYKGLQQDIHIDEFGDARINYTFMRVRGNSYEKIPSAP